MSFHTSSETGNFSTRVRDNECPTEIWIRIFQLAVNSDVDLQAQWDNPSFGAEVKRSWVTAWVISQVCSLWRLISLNAPELWTHFNTDLWRHSEGEYVPGCLEWQLHRSSPLPIAFMHKYHTIGRSDALCVSMWKMLTAQSERWRSVYIGILWGERTVEAMFLPVSLPILKQLTIHHDARVVDTALTVDLPALRSLTSGLPALLHLCAGRATATLAELRLPQMSHSDNIALLPRILRLVTGTLKHLHLPSGQNLESFHHLNFPNLISFSIALNKRAAENHSEHDLFRMTHSESLEVLAVPTVRIYWPGLKAALHDSECRLLHLEVAIPLADWHTAFDFAHEIEYGSLSRLRHLRVVGLQFSEAALVAVLRSRYIVDKAVMEDMVLQGVAGQRQSGYQSRDLDFFQWDDKTGITKFPWRETPLIPYRSVSLGYEGYAAGYLDI